jgi:hypothetical protein
MLPSPTNLARLGHFPPASQAGRLAAPVFYAYVFSLVLLVPKAMEKKSPGLVSRCLAYRMTPSRP